jgi:hypothetical protein
MTFDPPFCDPCGHFLANDWWHDAGCPSTSAASQSAEGEPALSATDEQIALPQHRTSSDGSDLALLAAASGSSNMRPATTTSASCPECSP